ncbi:two-component system C4-dicarboxylate transport sensor histidine kinase DctB [Rhizobium skierniewicense]|uniref:C4-dicarboxylate transport sensor protein n=1 Tax=Rhizobium skierniewicense TaxID=984260 RepID=A0A7W6G173_9HYPH|nr:ATP-binding protein [Rhizobium skierniewicense]MBB3945457.1 two-component system C4-dicarboxylate transport sensor histidine kinase DctB [Rhizobium skierniewicense]
MSQDFDTSRMRWIAFIAMWIIIAIGAFTAADKVGRIKAMKTLAATATTDAELKSALLNVALERPRVLPLVLSRDKDLMEALEAGGPSIERLDRKLEGLIEGTQASVIYVVDKDGVTVASSNWQSQESFVGSNYAFREYFQGAMRSGASEHYALGNVSRKPGLYISRRVDTAQGQALGVVIAKVEFNRLEADWSIGGRPVFTVDANGVVLMTSIPEWRFTTVAPIEQARRQSIADSLQFGDEKLSPLPMRVVHNLGDHVVIVDVDTPAKLKGEYLRLELPIATTAWSLHYLQPIAATTNAAIREMRTIAAASLMPLIAFSAIWMWRRQKAARERAAAEHDRTELERRVQERTIDLTMARDRLQAEIIRHEQTTEELQSVQHELVKANRLSILGQVAAGVAHEINQPVATIRAFADNARVFLRRDRKQDADENLESIASLTERIGVITSDLKILARKGRTAAEPVSIRLVIEGAVMLLRSRFAGRMDALDIEPPAEDMMVSGSRIRLEQILINLLQNALEAVEDRRDGQVVVRVEEADNEVVVSIADNGPGIAHDIQQQLFSPFNTSKEGGLGLGLVISRDIASDYGGRIEVETGEDGTRFSVYLKRV